MQKTNLKLSFILPLLLCLCHLQAQDYFGIRGGVNIADVKTSKDASITDGKIVGIHSSIFFDIGLTKSLSVQPELDFTQKGFKRKLPNHTSIYKLNYFNHSILLKYSIGKETGKIYGSLLAGPYIGRAWSGKIKNPNTNEVKDLDFFGGVGLSQGEYGLLFGGGLNYSFGKKGKNNILLDCRYSLGLDDINSHDGSHGDINTRGIVVSVGYAVRLGQ